MSESGEIQGSLVRELMTPSPSLPFEMKRRQEGGGVSVFKYRVRLLRPEETIEALADAQKYAKARGEISSEYGDIYRESQTVEIVLRALCEPELVERPDGTRMWRRAFVSAEQLRSALFEHELAQVMNCYETAKAYYRVGPQFTRDKLAPFVEQLSDELKNIYFFSRLDFADVPELIFSLAREVADLWQATGLTPSDSHSSSESTSPSSTSTITEFFELPETQSSALPGKTLPTDHMLTRDEAREIVLAAQESLEADADNQK
jgi:hypothetical protein